jgi:anti-sigma factor RsiW
MSRKNCIKEILLSEYLDGELPEDALKNVREHLASCRKCNAVYERMKADRSMLMEYLPDPSPPAHMKSQLMRRIRTAPENGRHSGVGWLFPFSSKAWAFAGAAAVFLAVAISAFQLQRHFEEAKILAEIDRSGAQIAARDFSLNPFNIYIQGAPQQVAAENPFKHFLNDR